MTATEPISSPPLTITPWRRIGWNSVWLLLARVAGQALALAFALLIARRLGEVVLGQYAFISTVLLIGNIATNLGTDTIVIRHIAGNSPGTRSATSDLLTTALLIQLALSAVIITAVWLWGGRLPNQTAETLPAFRLISLALVPAAFSGVLSAALRGRERMGLYLIFSLVTAATLVVGAVLVVQRSGGLFGLALATVASQTLGALAAALLVARLRPELGWRLTRPSGTLVRSVAQAGLVLAALMVTTLVLGRLGTLSLSLLDGDAATGFYSAAARLVEGLKMVPAAVLGALFPVMARGAGNAGAATHLDHTLRRMLAAAGVGTVIVALMTGFLAKPIIALLYGPGYAPSAAVLSVLVWALPFSVIALSLSFRLVAAGNERVVLTVLLPALTLAALLMAWLITHNGLMGAAIGSVLAEAIQMVALLVAWRIIHNP